MTRQLWRENSDDIVLANVGSVDWILTKVSDNYTPDTWRLDASSYAPARFTYGNPYSIWQCIFSSRPLT